MRLGNQYDMKRLKLVGLCLLAMFAVSMVSVGAAQASAWEECGTENASKEGTKYTTDQCSTASSSGSWTWQAAAEENTVRSKGSLILRDKKTTAGESEVECYVEGEGAFIEVEKVKVLSCRAIKLCEAKTVEVEAVDLPWKIEAFETEKKLSAALSEEGSSGKPGLKVKCKVAGVSVEDTCKFTGTESLGLENKHIGSELLILATYDKLKVKRNALSRAKNLVKQREAWLFQRRAGEGSVMQNYWVLWPDAVEGAGPRLMDARSRRPTKNAQSS